MSARILVADDSSTIQKVIKIALAAYDVTIVEASSLVEAISEVGRHAFDLLILDASLPGARSAEDFAKLRGDAGDKPVLLLAGTYDSVDDGTFHDAGLSEFLKKPFGSADIIERANNLLEGQLSGQMPPPPARDEGTSPVLNLQPEHGEPEFPPAEQSDDVETPVPPPPQTEAARRGQPAFDQLEETKGSGQKIDIMAPPGGTVIGEYPSDNEQAQRFAESVPPPPPEASRTDLPAADADPLPVVPSEAGQFAGAGESTRASEDSYHDAAPDGDEGMSDDPFGPDTGAKLTQDVRGDLLRAVEDLVEERLPDQVRAAVNDYCDRHFKSLARDVITTELRRLADEKARQLVDN